MTDKEQSHKEKLEKIFEAALKDPSPPTNAGHPPRSSPAPPSQQVSIPFEAPARSSTAPNAPILDAAETDQLGVLLDNQAQRQSRKHRRNSLVTALIFFSLVGGGVGWFVHSPERVEALGSAMHEVRSVTDVKTIVGKYQSSLDRISARSQQLDEATTTMGVTKSAEDDKDPYMDAEMKDIMGGEDKTGSARSKALQKILGDRANTSRRPP